MLKMLPPKKSSRQLTEERLENLWSTAPEEFDSRRNCREKDRLERTWEIIQKIPQLQTKIVIDAGCGNGEIARRLKNLGATVHALDCSAIPLKNLQNDDIKCIHDCLPRTRLEDSFYDLVICTDVIAYLPPQEHRLMMLELSRVVKKAGYIVCSSPLDIYSEDTLTIFDSLFKTEFVIHERILSYHSLHIRIRDFLEAPARVAKQKTSRFWRAIAIMLTPLTYIFRHNIRVLTACETLSKIFKDEDGVSHVICLGTRKPLVY